MSHLMVYILMYMLWGLSRTVSGEETDNMFHLKDIINTAAIQAREAENWNLLENAYELQGKTVEVTTGKLLPQEGSSTKLFIPVKKGELCAFYAYSEKRFDVAYYDDEYRYLSGEILFIKNGMLYELPEQCSYVTISVTDDESEEYFFTQENQNDVYFVSNEDLFYKTQYDSIRSVVNKIEEKGVIIVFPGTYKGTVKAWGKDITIIGTSRDDCILENHSGSYYAPPLEISVGEVRNMTIQAHGQGTSDKPGAYGVHVEDHSLYNNSLTFRNCIIKSDSNSAVGIGMRGGCDVQFVDCTLTGKEDGLFCHDGAYQKYTGVQNISLVRCTIEGLNGSHAVRFDSQGVKGAEVNVLLVDNTLVNRNSTNSGKLVYACNNGGNGTDTNWMGLKNFYLSAESKGNNVDEMNYG